MPFGRRQHRTEVRKQKIEIPTSKSARENSAPEGALDVNAAGSPETDGAAAVMTEELPAVGAAIDERQDAPAPPTSVAESKALLDRPGILFDDDYDADGEPVSLTWEMMNGKPVFYREAKTVLTIPSEKFHEKLLCDGMVLNLGDACGFSCTFCYVMLVVLKLVKPILDAHNLIEEAKATANGEEYEPLKFQDVVIRRKDALKVLESQLVNPDGSRKWDGQLTGLTLYSSTLVDVGANMTLLRETAAACLLIFQHTSWQIRLLSKSPLLKLLVEKEMIPKEYHHRLILGFSIGTLDDDLAKAIEKGTGLVSKRLEAHHWLQDNGIRTFGMICPSLPQEDYDRFSREVCAAIRIERCEHVWAEVLNVRGESLTLTTKALREAGFQKEADQLEAVSEPDGAAAWEEYARATFLAHTKTVPANKLRFLQYVDAKSADWWAGQRDKGAILIGAEAERRGLLTGGESAPAEPLPSLKKADKEYRRQREELVTIGFEASIVAAKALHEIHSYKGGMLWKENYRSFWGYCEAKWGYKKSQAYRLRDTGRFLCEIGDPHSPAGERQPTSEGQIRPLLDAVPTEHQAECWKEIVKDKDPRDLTGPLVAKEAKKFVRKLELAAKRETSVDAREPDPDSKDAPPDSSPPEEVDGALVAAQNQARATLRALRSNLRKLPPANRFSPMLYAIGTLIDQTTE